jgi:hypothetical protein
MDKSITCLQLQQGRAREELQVDQLASAKNGGFLSVTINQPIHCVANSTYKTEIL